MPEQRKLRISFHDTNHRPVLTAVDADYKIEIKGDWLVLPNGGLVRADAILTAQIVTEDRVLKAA